MAKRANGEGTVYEDPKNRRWVGEVMLDGHRRRVTGRTKKEAAQRLHLRIQESQEGAPVMTESATLLSLLNLWEREELNHRQIAASSRYRFQWQLATLRAELGSVRLRKLDASHIHQMFLRLTKPTATRKAYSRSTLVALRSTLGQVLTFAVGRRLFPVNLAPSARIPESAHREEGRGALTVEQAHRFWEACDTHRLGAYWQTMMATGLRPGEAAGLTWRQLKLDGPHPSATISRQVRLVSGRPELVDGVKTKGSYRTLGIPRALVPVLKAHREAQRLERMAASSWANPELVFTTSRGGPLNPSNVRRDLTRFAWEQGLPRVSPNELRHTAASLLLAEGKTLEQVAKVLGHDSTRMLERYYGHEIRPVVDDHVAVMDQLFGGRS